MGLGTSLLLDIRERALSLANHFKSTVLKDPKLHDLDHEHFEIGFIAPMSVDHILSCLPFCYLSCLFLSCHFD